MPLKLRILLLLALGACTSSRPDGAYTPKYEAPSSDGCKAGFDCETDSGTSDAVTSDAGETVVENPGQDAGDSQPDPDAGEPVVVDPSNPLSGLAGRYLMRVDYYTTDSATDSTTGTTLTLKSRVSNLFLTVLAVGDGAVAAAEQLCDQTSTHLCVSGCRDWKTSYSDGRLAKIKAMNPVTRKYAIDAQGLLTATADGALLRLGYDDTQFSTAPIPSDKADARVWQITTSSGAMQYGMPTYLSGTLLPLGVPTALGCEVDSVQLFATAFQGTLPTLDAAGLASKIMAVSSDGSSAFPVYASGGPTQVCDLKTLQNKAGESSGGKAFVRFQKTTLTACPANGAAFEAAFPLPSAENLDVPTPR